MALLGAAAATFLLVAPSSVAESTTGTVVLAAAGAGAVLILIIALYGARRATARVHDRLDALRFSSTRGQENLQRLVERVRNGERFAPSSVAAPPAEESEPFVLLEYELHKGQCAAQNAVLHVAALKPNGASEQQEPEPQEPGHQDSEHKEPGQQVEVFVNVARRMQSLVHREIGLLDELEAQVEDPDLLKGLFTIDHLATRMRRQSESLAVLGGAASRRQWSRPVSLYEVLRSAVAEVEHYSRVKVVPPVEGTLDGSAVVDVIHLVAELIENATKFSPPHTQVLLRTDAVTAGVVIEVEDRGLGMQPEDQRQMNSLLADPDHVNLSELLRDGRIGLFVVSTLARKNGAKVQLQPNLYGGTQAVVVLPQKLVGSEAQEREAQQRTQSARPEPAPAMAAAAPAASAPPHPVEVPVPVPDPGARSGQAPRREHQPAPGPGQAPRREHQPAPGPGQLPTREHQPAPGPGQLPTREHQPAPGSGQLPTRDYQYAADNRPNGSPNPPSDARRPSLPERDPGAQRPQDPDQDVRSAPATDLTPKDRTDRSERPPLPQRRVQTHLAPQLRDSPTSRRDEADSEHSPGLMAAFRGGISRAEDEKENENGPPGRPDNTS